MLIDDDDSFVLDSYNILLNEEIVSTFSSQFLARDTQEDMKEGFDRFCSAVGRLYADLKMLSLGLEELSSLREVCSTHSTSYGERTVLGLFCLALRGTLHSQIPHHWEELVRQFYSQAFSTFYKSGDRPNSSVQDMEDSGDWSRIPYLWRMW